MHGGEAGGQLHLQLQGCRQECAAAQLPAPLQAPCPRSPVTMSAHDSCRPGLLDTARGVMSVLADVQV